MAPPNPRYKYIGSTATSIADTAVLGRALDEAPRPYSASELSEITGIPRNAVAGWLAKNRDTGRISSRPRPRATGTGKPVAEYWRGNLTVGETFRTEDNMGQVRIKITSGERPVAWRDRTHAQYSIDPADTLAVMRGNASTPIGRVREIKETQHGVKIAVENGPVLCFEDLR